MICGRVLVRHSWIQKRRRDIFVQFPFAPLRPENNILFLLLSVSSLLSHYLFSFLFYSHPPILFLLLFLPYQHLLFVLCLSMQIYFSSIAFPLSLSLSLALSMLFVICSFSLTALLHNSLSTKFIFSCSSFRCFLQVYHPVSAKAALCALTFLLLLFFF